jgi:hypothetical protein
MIGGESLDNLSPHQGCHAPEVILMDSAFNPQDVNTGGVLIALRRKRHLCASPRSLKTGRNRFHYG